MYESLTLRLSWSNCRMLAKLAQNQESIPAMGVSPKITLFAPGVIERLICNEETR
jgi:hypothetical protein